VAGPQRRNNHWQDRSGLNTSSGPNGGPWRCSVRCGSADKAHAHVVLGNVTHRCAGKRTQTLRCSCTSDTACWPMPAALKLPCRPGSAAGTCARVREMSAAHAISRLVRQPHGLSLKAGPELGLREDHGQCGRTDCELHLRTDPQPRVTCSQPFDPSGAHHCSGCEQSSCGNLPSTEVEDCLPH
jgi:hypothetical protein